MNKHIEEMAKDIRTAETEYMVAMVTADIDDVIDVAAPRNERLATALYEKGYRKTEDIAREIFEEIEGKLGIGHDIFDAWRIIEELKKKYESEGVE